MWWIETLDEARDIDADVRDGGCPRSGWNNRQTYGVLASVFNICRSDKMSSRFHSPKSGTNSPLWMRNLRTKLVEYLWQWPEPYWYGKPPILKSQTQEARELAEAVWMADMQGNLGWRRATANELYTGISTAPRRRWQLLHLQRYLQAGIRTVEEAPVHRNYRASIKTCRYHALELWFVEIVDSISFVAFSEEK